MKISHLSNYIETFCFEFDRSSLAMGINVKGPGGYEGLVQRKLRARKFMRK